MPHNKAVRADWPNGSTGKRKRWQMRIIFFKIVLFLGTPRSPKALVLLEAYVSHISYSESKQSHLQHNTATRTSSGTRSSNSHRAYLAKLTCSVDTSLIVAMFINVNTLALQVFHVLTILLWDMLPICLHFFVTYISILSEMWRKPTRLSIKIPSKRESCNTDSFPSKLLEALYRFNLRVSPFLDIPKHPAAGRSTSPYSALYASPVSTAS